MPSISHSLMSYLRVVVGAWRNDPRDDAELLARFAQARDEAAFATLVWRHGALVLGTCRRVLGNTPDAEDAFQTTFLALARKAGRFPVESLAGWLHRVARQTAMDVRSKSQRSQDLQRRLRAVAQPEPQESLDRDELFAVLDEELVGLPERLRVPLVLRYLEGKTLEEVAHIVGCSRRDLSRRLLRGEAILRQRLEQRGLTVGVLSLAALLGGTTAASAMPALLAHSTVKAALSTAAPAADGFLSAWVTGWAKWVLRTLCGGKTLPLILGVAAVCFWYVNAGTQLRTLNATVGRYAHLGKVFTLAFSRDGKSLVSGGSDGAVRPWELASGKQRPTWEGHQERIGSVVFSPDGQTLASASMDNTVRLWDAATGKQQRQVDGPRDSVFYLVAVSPDGKILAPGSHYKGIRLWEAATGQEVQRLLGHDDEASAVAFSPDGKTLASSGPDQTVVLWDLATGEEWSIWKLRTWWAVKLAFSPDGKMSTK